MKSLNILLACSIRVFGFQPLVGTNHKRTELRYQNKTEPYYSVETPSTYAIPWSPKAREGYSDQNLDTWDDYQRSSAYAALPDNHHQYYNSAPNYQYQANDVDWAPSFNEGANLDDGIVPTLETLKAWTEEYWDAVDLAGGLTRVSVGVENMLADDFVFTSPSIGPVNKFDFIQLMKYYCHSGFDLASAVPDLSIILDGWHQDPHEPYRVWVVVRYAGTHSGTVWVPGTEIALEAPRLENRHYFVSGPEVQSFLWTRDKQILWQTMGYVGDEYTGSNKGHGGLDGLLVSMGLPPMYLDAVSPMRRMIHWFEQFQNDHGEDYTPRAKTRTRLLPDWWNRRKTYDLNIQK